MEKLVYSIIILASVLFAPNLFFKYVPDDIYAALLKLISAGGYINPLLAISIFVFVFSLLFGVVLVLLIKKTIKSFFSEKK